MIKELPERMRDGPACAGRDKTASHVRQAQDDNKTEDASGTSSLFQSIGLEIPSHPFPFKMEALLQVLHQPPTPKASQIKRDIFARDPSPPSNVQQLPLLHHRQPKRPLLSSSLLQPQFTDDEENVNRAGHKRAKAELDDSFLRPLRPVNTPRPLINAEGPKLVPVWGNRSFTMQIRAFSSDLDMYSLESPLARLSV